jgi:hypothetical protein
MSYDVIKSIQSQQVVVKGLDDDTRAVAGNGSYSKRISIKGGVFRKMSGGKQVAAIEDRHMNVIFVKMAHHPSRTLYTQGYQEGTKVSPTCWSSDSKVPDPECQTPQASACDKCQFSVKGSGHTGQGSACRLSWRTAVVLPNDPDGDVMQLVLPATSVFGKEVDGKYPFKAYVQFLANNNVSAGRVVTRMQFDTNSPVPKLLFSAAAAVPTEELETIRDQGLTNAAINAVKMTVFQQDEGKGEGAEPAAYVDPYDAPAPQEAAEPVVRESAKKAEAPAESDMSDVLKKWGKKK